MTPPILSLLASILFFELCLYVVFVITSRARRLLHLRLWLWWNNVCPEHGNKELDWLGDYYCTTCLELRKEKRLRYRAEYLEKK